MSCQQGREDHYINPDRTKYFDFMSTGIQPQIGKSNYITSKNLVSHYQVQQRPYVSLNLQVLHFDAHTQACHVHQRPSEYAR